MTQANETPPTVITLTLPTPQGGGIAPERATATLLIQRGELAHMHQFHYHGALPDLMNAIRQAHDALAQMETNPPVIPDLPEETPKPEPKMGKAAQKPQAQADEEPTIDIPLRKGVKAVKMRHIRIIGGETDAAAYRQAVLIAGRLIAGGLWDGESPIHIDDVYATMKRMKHLADEEFSLFTLEDFVRTGTVMEASEPSDVGLSAHDAIGVASASRNGHHHGEAPDLRATRSVH
jgi:hypothetical protein